MVGGLYDVLDIDWLSLLTCNVTPLVPGIQIRIYIYIYFPRDLLHVCVPLCVCVCTHILIGGSLGYIFKMVDVMFSLLFQLGKKGFFVS
jgi:hypothetical protein